MQKIKIPCNILIIIFIAVFSSNIVHADVNNSEKGITRIEFAKLINKTFSFSEKTETPFRDIKPGSGYADEVKKAVAEGYMLGYGDRTFRPESI
jgi:hypothetical protein